MKSFKTFLKEEERKKVTFKGEKTKNFREYVRSEGELKRTVKEKLGYAGKIKIEHIAELYAKYRIAVADNVEFEFDTDDVYKYREFDRKLVDGWTGSRDAGEIEELEKSIKASGIKQHVYIRMERDNETGSTDVYLGEGNHRLSIARKLGIKKMPVRIYFT